ncbi:unnamed protein product [Prunus armeniaca]
MFNLQGRFCQIFGRKSRVLIPSLKKEVMVLVSGLDIGVMSGISTGFVPSFEKFGAGPVIRRWSGMGWGC